MKKKEFIISDDDAAHGSFHEYFIYCLLARRWLCQQKKNGTMQLRADHNQEFTSTLVNGKVANCGGGYTSENDWRELNLSFPDNVDELFENVGIRLVIK